ncbi:23S rRNA pseudouridine(2605) synthase RluB [Chitinimonas taiwanensis]|uniref:23S rRNA pseudouridine(2605) synthase RluB n=1 Tax=Chitinimonas taiwanensis TaxID=240412 RepID=UPI0035B4E669
MAPPRKPAPKSPASYTGNAPAPRGAGRGRPQPGGPAGRDESRGRFTEEGGRGRGNAAPTGRGARGQASAGPDGRYGQEPRAPRGAAGDTRYEQGGRDTRRAPVDGNRAAPTGGPRGRNPEGAPARGPRGGQAEGRYGEQPRDTRRGPVDGNRAAPAGPRGEGRARTQGDAPAGRKPQFEQHVMGGRAFGSVEERQRKRYGEDGGEAASRGERVARQPRVQLDADARREQRKANAVQAAPVVERAKKLRLRRGSEKQEADAQQLREKRVDVKYIGDLRIQKALALSGVGSRRDCDEWVSHGRVSINGKLAEPGSRVSPGDQVRFDGKPVDIKWPDRLPRILMYHKQEGELVSRDDPEGRTTVFDRLPKVQSSAWVAVGRLDYNTSGLLIFTTSGDLANRMMHPSFEVEREYAVRVLGSLTEEQRQQMLDGIELEDGMASFQTMQDQGGEGMNHWYRVILKEGRNREVRRMFEHFGLTVSRLMRVRFGMLNLPGRLKRGQYYELDEREVLSVLKWAGLNMTGRTPDR